MEFALALLNRFYLELFIAIRYLRGQGRTVVFSLGTRLSVLFMAFMVFIMVLVLAVFNGFQEEVHNSLWNSGYHITVANSSAGQPLPDYNAIVAALRRDERISAQARSIFGSISVNVLLDAENRFEGKAVRALPVSDQELLTGKLQDFPNIVHYDLEYLRHFNQGNYVIVGREMARYYGWQVGDQIKLFLPQGLAISRGMQISQADFIIAGFFRTGYYEFDLNLIFMSLATAQRSLGLGDRASEVIVQLRDLGSLDGTKKDVREGLPGNPYFYTIRSIKEERGNFLAALQLEKTMMIIILGLLIVAGVAGIWVTVHLLIQSKSKSIGMLRAMGLPAISVIVIFTANSMLIGFLSTAIGASLGIFVAERLEILIQMVEDLLNAICLWYAPNCSTIHLIPKNIYYFDHLPVHSDIHIIFGVSLATLVLSGLAGYFPARKAAMMEPVETIRND